MPDGDYGDWQNYVLGFDESLDNINDTLTRCGKQELYKYFDTIFDRIAGPLAIHPKTYPHRLDHEIANHLKQFEGDERLNKLILLTIYQISYREWENTLRHPPVHALVYGAVKYYAKYAERLNDQQQHIYILFFRLLAILACGMRVENALNIDCPAGIRKHTERVNKLVIPPDCWPDAWDEADAVLVDWLKGEISDSRLYFERVHQLSSAVTDWLQNKPDWRKAVADALKDGRFVIDSDLKQDSFAYATELDAHLQTLSRIQEFGEVTPFVEHFKATYCFPFLICESESNDLVLLKHIQPKLDTIIAEWRHLVAEGKGSRVVDEAFSRAFVPTSQEKVELTDVWSVPAEMGQAAQPGNGQETNAGPSVSNRQRGSGIEHYNLQAINFPDIIITDVGDPTMTIRLHCEIRLSAFGNHYVRLYAERGEQHDYEGFATIKHHDIHRALRRASSLCGKEPISTDGGESAPHSYRNHPEGAGGLYEPDGNLMDVIKKLVQRFDEILRKHGMRAVHDIAKTSNVIFSLIEFNEQLDFNAKKREDALHRIFVNPIGGPADRLEPWLSRSKSRRRDGRYFVRNLAQGELGDNAQIYTTANTTLIRLPSHANFVRMDYEEMAEFVASLEPLYVHWNAEISRRMQEVLEDLRRENLAKIEDSRIALQQVVVSARKAMLDIESPVIVTNSVYRSYLDAFIKQSTVNALQKNFHSLTSTTQAVVDAVSDYAQKRTDKKIQWQRNFVAVAIGAVGVLLAFGQLTDIKLLCVADGCKSIWPILGSAVRSLWAGVQNYL